MVLCNRASFEIFIINELTATVLRRNAAENVFKEPVELFE
jgi:hypothetical protein